MSSIERSELLTSEVTTVAGISLAMNLALKNGETDGYVSPAEKITQKVPLWLVKKLGASKYCTYCQNILDDWSRLLSGERPNDLKAIKYPHHETLESLQTAATQGCKVCWLFYQHLKELSGRDIDSGYPSRIDDLEDREKRGETVFGILELCPTVYWRIKLSPDGWKNGYEGPFVDWDEWRINLQNLNSRHATSRNAFSIMAATSPGTKHHLLRILYEI